MEEAEIQTKIKGGEKMAELEEVEFSECMGERNYSGNIVIINEKDEDEISKTDKKRKEDEEKILRSSKVLEDLIIFPGSEIFFAKTYGHDLKKIELIDRGYKNKGVLIGKGVLWNYYFESMYAKKGTTIIEPRADDDRKYRNELVQLGHSGIVALIYATKTDKGWYGLPVKIKK